MSDELSKHITYYLDAVWDKKIDDITELEPDAFSPLSTPSPNFGFTEDKVWLSLDVENATADVDTWYFYVHENFLQYFDVYVQREDGTIEHLTSYDPDSRFSDREISFPQLVTEIPFLPGEEITIFVSYSSGGSSNISLSFETKDSFSAKSFQQTSKTFISYGMMLILIITSTLALVILRRRVFFSYMIYVIVTLLFLMHSDGVTFQYFWPKHPLFNSYFSIIIGLAFAIVPYNFARVFLRTNIYHPRLDKFMVWIMIVTPICVIPGAFIDPQSTKKFLMVLVLLAIGIGTFAGVLASFDRFREVRFYLFAWIFGIMSAGVMNLRHFTALDIGQNLELDSIRVSIVIDAIMMGLGVADRHLQSLKDSRRADKKNLEQARLNLQLNNRLYDLEEQYVLATELVASRDEEMKKTVHDLRDPLHALRLNIQKLRNAEQPEEKGGAQTARDTNGEGNGINFDDTFTYLETIIADYLQSSVSDMDVVASQSSDDETTLNLPGTLRAIYDMFQPDAFEKGLDFRYVETSLQTDVDPFDVMRIVTNLVSNAIKYTPNGKVILGVRRTDELINIEVHDTGIGMNAAEFARAKEASVRLLNSDVSSGGYGYGLSVVSELVAKNKLKLAILPERNDGTSIVLSIPRKS